MCPVTPATTGVIHLLVTDYHLRDGQTGTEAITALRRALGRSLKCVLIMGNTSSSIRELPRDPLLRVASKSALAELRLTLIRTLNGHDSAVAC